MGDFGVIDGLACGGAEGDEVSGRYMPRGLYIAGGPEGSPCRRTNEVVYRNLRVSVPLACVGHHVHCNVIQRRGKDPGELAPSNLRLSVSKETERDSSSSAHQQCNTLPPIGTTVRRG